MHITHLDILISYKIRYFQYELHCSIKIFSFSSIHFIILNLGNDHILPLNIKALVQFI